MLTPVLHLIPIGEIEPAIIYDIGKNLERSFDVPVKNEKGFPLPADTYAPSREQHHSTALLRRLRIFYPLKLGFSTLLGVVDQDLFVPQLNFVFGEGDSSTRTAIISITRLRPEFYGLPDDTGLLRARASKEAIHEIGHAYGLTHCPDPSCIMFFSNRLEDTDAKGPGFCRLHQDRLGELVKAGNR